MRWRAPLAGVVLWSAQLTAHPLTRPSVRELTLWVEPPQARLEYVLLLGADVAAPLRLTADTNHSGQVSAIEGNRQLDQLTREVIHGIRICSGGYCRQPESRELELVEADGWNGQEHLHLRWRLRLSGLESGVQIEDQGHLSGVHLTQVEIRGQTDRLTRAGPGDPEGVVTRFAWRAGKSRKITAEWEATVGSHWLVGLVVALIVLLPFAPRILRARGEH